LHGVAQTLFREDRQIEHIIRVLKEGGLPPVPALRDMMRQVRHHHPSETRHTLILPHNMAIDNMPL